jgi:hypothetical protein
MIKTDQKPVDQRRLGSFTKEEEKVRPLRLTFSSEAIRNSVITAFHKARKTAGNANANDMDSDFAQVAMRKDLTPKEREEEAALFQELKSRKQESQDSGDEHAHWIRRKGKIENVGKYPQGEANGDC